MRKNKIIVISLTILLVITFFLSFTFNEPLRNCESEKENKIMCYADEAARTGNMTLCDQFLGINKTICYTSVGIYLKDPQICEYLTVENENYFCYTQVIKELSGIKDCENSEKKLEAKCVAYYSLYLLSSGECEAQKDNQQDLCFELVAKNLNDANMCDKADEKHTDICEKYIE